MPALEALAAFRFRQQHEKLSSFRDAASLSMWSAETLKPRGNAVLRDDFWDRTLQAYRDSKS